MEKIKLKSKLIIRLVGKDEITLEELSNVEDLLLNGAGIDFSSDEINNIQEDLEYIFLESRENNREISLINCPDSIVEYVLKNSATHEIYFEGREEFEQRLKSKKIKVSAELKKYIGSDEDLTEYEVFEYVKTMKLLELGFIISLDDFELIRKYANISDYKLRIKNLDEYKRFLQISGGEYPILIIDEILTAQLLDFDAMIWADMKFSVELETILDLSTEQLNWLNEFGSVENIRVLYGPDDIDEYSLDEFEKLEGKIQEILDNIDMDSPELDRFIKIYQKLGNDISYEFDDDGNPSKRSEAHNLKGGLFEYSCVCEGYAKILHQVLKCTGIENRFVFGPARNENSSHAWNQVKIDDVWYNCDLTWDSPAIQARCALEYCLQSDEEFVFHTPQSKDVEKCYVSYDKNKMHSRLDYYLPLEFESREYTADDIILLLESIKKYSFDGVRISINEEHLSGRFSLGIGNIIGNDDAIWSESEAFISDIQSFIRRYMEEYSTTSVERMGIANFIKSDSGTELVITEGLMDSLTSGGLNLDKLFEIKRTIHDRSKLLKGIRGMGEDEYQIACSSMEQDWRVRRHERDRGNGVEMTK